MRALASAADWSQPAEVRHEDALVISYTARVDGPYLVVRANIGQGWHTFALDNVQRVEEKLAGKPALSMDRSTEIAVTGVQVEGPWHQSPPKDFSRPDLRMFSFGYDHDVSLRREGPPQRAPVPRSYAFAARRARRPSVRTSTSRSRSPCRQSRGRSAEVKLDELVQAR